MPRTSDRDINQIIGARVKTYRKRANISQTALGKHLGVSFQQIQKYENGTNKLSAAKLRDIARCLEVSVAELAMIDDGSKRKQSNNDQDRFARSREGKSLLNGFMAIENPSIKRCFLEMVAAVGRKAKS